MEISHFHIWPFAWFSDSSSTSLDFQSRLLEFPPVTNVCESCSSLRRTFYNPGHCHPFCAAGKRAVTNIPSRLVYITTTDSHFLLLSSTWWSKKCYLKWPIFHISVTVLYCRFVTKTILIGVLDFDRNMKLNYKCIQIAAGGNGQIVPDARRPRPCSCYQLFTYGGKLVLRGSSIVWGWGWELLTRVF